MGEIEDWKSALEVDNVAVTDSSRDLIYLAVCGHCSLLNRFRTCQGRCLAILHKCGLARGLKYNFKVAGTVKIPGLPVKICGPFSILQLAHVF